MARVVHYSHRVASLIDQRLLDGSPAWEQSVDGSMAQAEKMLREQYGKPWRVSRFTDCTVLKWAGFLLYIYEESDSALDQSDQRAHRVLGSVP